MEIKLFNIAVIKTNFPEADFWVIRKGSEDKVGTPTRDYHPERIGVLVEQTEIVLPDFLFYVLQHLQSLGYFKRLAKGTLSLKHITVKDVEQIRLGIKR